jgi:hypothetical protein
MARVYLYISGYIDQMKRLGHAEKLDVKLKHFLLFVTEHDLVER